MKNTNSNLTKLLIENIDQILYNLDMSVRQIKKSYISCTGYFASYKNKKQMMFESVLERDFFMLLEFDNNVASYIEQPLTIKSPSYDGTIRKYTPDVLVTYRNKTQKLFEVKYENELTSNQDLQQKLQILKIYFQKEHQLVFETFTDQDIGKTYLENLKFLYFYAFLDENKHILEKINTTLNNTNSISIKDLLNEIEPNKSQQIYKLPYIWHYVFLQCVKPNHIKVVNLFKKLTMNTELKKRC